MTTKIHHCLIFPFAVLQLLMTSAFAENSATELAGVHILRSGNLVVEVMDPNDPGRYNRGVRFSNVANILRVSLGGKEFLFSPVKHDPILENGGLSPEFDLRSEEPPAGYSEAAIGDGFLKIGVGVLKKTEEQYNFWTVLPIVELAPTSVEWSPDSARFDQVSTGVNGFAYRLQAQISLSADVVELKFQLTNTGKRAFSTEQYTHNFFAFDSAPVGPNYSVKFPYALPPSTLIAGVVQKGEEVDFTATLGETLNLRMTTPEGISGKDAIVVSNSANGQSITVSTSIATHRASLFATSKYICPEQFILIHLSPGESSEWIRRYKFKAPLSTP